MGVDVRNDEVHVQVLGRLELRDGAAVLDLPDPVRRLVAYLAVVDRPVSRVALSARLWMDTTEDRAGASLRSALWRLRKTGAPVLTVEGSHIRLSRFVRTDLSELRWAARGLLADPRADEEPGATAELLAHDLLPDWYDDWVVIERERVRQLRLHALEALCIRMTSRGQYADAIDAGMLAVQAEPLRESSHRALVAAHIAEGNVSEAVRQYDLYSELLHEQLRTAPGHELRALIAPCR